MDTKNVLSSAAQKFFSNLEEKDLINLPMDIKRAMDQTGLACKGALYGIHESRFQKIFAKINEKIHSFKGRDFLQMTHQSQIIFMSKYITCELNQTIFKGSCELGKEEDNENESED